MTGGTIGHYQVLEPLGSGGMGEVFKARDTRLNRLVAIKVLREDLLASASRRRRFIQEAQSASALNHPNIVTIYDIFTHEGMDCLVMEYIAGKTLDALIPRHGMRLNEALRIAVQVAEGLRKAHSAGIIHRDIKPSNIMVPDDGPVKILDFGLAKLTESEESSGDETTRSERPVTEDGVVMGTIAYMSPEQAEGRKLDPRTDVFSFGAMLYEMLTGRRAFGSDSKLSTMSAILKEDPKPLESVPQDLERIVRRCLRKDRDKRYQHMGDLKLALEELKEESESGKLDKSRALAAPRPLTGYIAVAAAAVLAAGGLLWWRSREAQPVAAGYSLKQITSDTGLATTPAISSDGKLIAYSSDRQNEGNLDIWVQPLTADARPIRLTTSSADDLSPSFSPDGGTIAFYSKRDGGGIYLIPALGGEERLLAKNKVGYTAKPRFSPDGKWIAYASGMLLWDSQVMIAPVSGGPPKPLAPNLSWAGDPVWSPDGRHLAAIGRKAVDGDWEYWVIPAGGGPAVSTGTSAGELGKFGSTAEIHGWSPGFLFYSLQSSAWVFPIEEGSWKMGNPRKILESTAGLRYPLALGTRNGAPERIVFAGASRAIHLWSLSLDSNTGVVKGRPKPLTHSGGEQSMPALTADGRFLAYSQRGLGRQELRLRETATGKETSLVSGFARAKFSPDGSRIAYYNNEGVYVMDRSGGDPVKLLDGKPNTMESIYSWHRKGITYWTGNPIRFLLLDPITRQLRDLISHPTLAIHGAELSPDGNWIAFHIPGAAREPLYIAPVREGKAAEQTEWIRISDSPGVNRRPWWSTDGKLIYWLSERNGPIGICAQRLSRDKRPLGPPFAVIQFPETHRAPNRLSGAMFGPGIATNQIVFSMTEESGNIWLAEANK